MPVIEHKDAGFITFYKICNYFAKTEIKSLRNLYHE